MRFESNTYCLRCFLMLLGLFLSIRLCAQQQAPDTKYREVFQEGVQLYGQFDCQGSYELGLDALSLAEKMHDVRASSDINYLLAQVSSCLGNGKSSEYLYAALVGYEHLGDTASMMSAYAGLSEAYFQYGAIDESLHFDRLLLKNLSLQGSQVTESLAGRFLKMSEKFMLIEDAANALKYAQKAYQYYAQSTAKGPEYLLSLNLLIETYQQNALYDEAIVYAEELVGYYQRTGDKASLAISLNELGVLLQKVQNERQAISRFKQAAALVESPAKNGSVNLYLNMGLVYTHMGNFQKAINFYQACLQHYIVKNDIAGQADSYNHLASSLYYAGRMNEALQAALKARQLASREDSLEILSTSYRLLEMIYDHERIDDKARLIAKYHRRLKERIAEQQVARMADLEHKEEVARKQAAFIRQRFNEKQQAALEQERKESKLKIQEQELTLLRREREAKDLEIKNANLQTRNTMQELDLTKKKLLAERQAKELESLQRAQQMDQLRIEQEQLKREQQQKAIRILETEGKLQQQALKQESSRKKNSYILLALSSITILSIAIGFYRKKRDHHKLKEAQDILLTQQQELEVAHLRTKESIIYAKHIQSSILPKEDLFSTAFSDHFIIYLPKDIVSGDFYWLSHLNNCIYLAVIDCTGHGVPGSLVTLIAHNHLSEAIYSHAIETPSQILDYLNEKLYRRFNMNNPTQQHGMDMGICRIEYGDEGVDIQYAGAKNRLWVLPEKGKSTTIRGDRFSAGSGEGVSYTNHSLKLEIDDRIYMTTDGFSDQANPERERYGRKRFSDMLTDINTMPMVEQKRLLMKSFEDHQQGTDQRDDICTIGIRL